MSSLLDYRLFILRNTASPKSFRDPWRIWKPIVKSALKPRPTGQKIFDFGEELSDLFQKNKVPGRNQSTLSGGGYAWECLNVWYLNLLFWGTSIIAARTSQTTVPECLRDALTVTHSSTTTNTESDISIFNIPDPTLLKKGTTSDLHQHLRTRINRVHFVNLQCKTNWNDNAQIPMLWDLIYNAQGFKMPSVSVGANGLTPNSFATFSYAFSTVPTVNVAKFNVNSLAVLRVKNLSGGNYWGHASKRGIALCINNLPGNHFGSEYAGGVINNLNNALRADASFIDNFINLNF